MKKRWAAPAAAALAVLLISAAAFAAVYASDSRYSTWTAVRYNGERVCGVSGIFLRAERAIDVGQGSAVYLAADGERVGKGQEIARVYPTEKDAEDAGRVSALREELETLYEVRRESAGAAPDRLLPAVAARIAGAQRRLRLGDAGGAADYRTGLTALLGQYEAYAGTGDCGRRIEELEGEIAALSAGLGEYRTVRSGEAGYFCSRGEGSAELGPDALSPLTLEALDSLIAAHSGPAAESPRLITDYRWYFTFSLPTSSAVLLANNIKLRFPAVSDRVFTAKTVRSVKDAGTGGRTAVTVSSIEGIRELAACRVESAEVILESSRGLRIPVAAIRTVESGDVPDQTGVYVIIGPRMVFRKIKVLTSDGDFAVCEETGKSGQLKLYDEVVVRGKNLYDGKRI